MTDKERLIKLLTGRTGKSWVLVPQDLHKLAREMSYKGEVEWYETGKKAKLNIVNEQQDEVVEALDNMSSNLKPF